MQSKVPPTDRLASLTDVQDKYCVEKGRQACFVVAAFGRHICVGFEWRVLLGVSAMLAALVSKVQQYL